MKAFKHGLLGLTFASMCTSGFCLDHEDGMRAVEERNPFLAAKIWTSLAEKGDLVSQSSLGRLYKNSILNFNCDYAKALYWLHKCEPKLFVCSLELAPMYEEGRGVEKNVPRAAELYKRVLEYDTFWSGLNEARVRLGVLHFRGEVDGSSNMKEAQKYMLLAAYEGSFKAVLSQ